MTDKYVCDECKNIVELDWDDVIDTYCEDCGSHPSAKCPVCGEYMDLVWSEEVK